MGATMFHRHITHLISGYVQGQLGPVQRAQVVNHVRACARCREALAREERIAADLRREMPHIGQPHPGQMARVWAGVWADIQTPRRPAGPRRSSWVPGLGMALAALLMIALALPLLAQSGMRAEAAPFEPGSNLVRSTASPTPGGTDEALAGAAGSVSAQALPQATVALVPAVGASPVPMPASTLIPDAPTDAADW